MYVTNLIVFCKKGMKETHFVCILSSLPRCLRLAEVIDDIACPNRRALGCDYMEIFLIFLITTSIRMTW
jgi:hypothetical protein